MCVMASQERLLSSFRQPSALGFQVTSGQVTTKIWPHLSLCDLLGLSRALLELVAELEARLHLRRGPQTDQPRATSHPSNGTTQASLALAEGRARLRAVTDRSLKRTDDRLRPGPGQSMASARRKAPLPKPRLRLRTTLAGQPFQSLLRAEICAKSADFWPKADP